MQNTEKNMNSEMILYLLAQNFSNPSYKAKLYSLMHTDIVVVESYRFQRYWKAGEVTSAIPKGDKINIYDVKDIRKSAKEWLMSTVVDSFRR